MFTESWSRDQLLQKGAYSFVLEDCWFECDSANSWSCRMRSSFIADVTNLSLDKVSVQLEFQSFISAQGGEAPSESNVLKTLIACLNRSFKLRFWSTHNTRESSNTLPFLEVLSCPLSFSSGSDPNVVWKAFFALLPMTVLVLKLSRSYFRKLQACETGGLQSLWNSELRARDPLPANWASSIFYEGHFCGWSTNRLKYQVFIEVSQYLCEVYFI